jgi:hypothetical protein
MRVDSWPVAVWHARLVWFLSHVVLYGTCTKSNFIDFCKWLAGLVRWGGRMRVVLITRVHERKIHPNATARRASWKMLSTSQPSAGIFSQPLGLLSKIREPPCYLDKNVINFPAVSGNLLANLSSEFREPPCSEFYPSAGTHTSSRMTRHRNLSHSPKFVATSKVTWKRQEVIWENNRSSRFLNGSREASHQSLQ